MWAKCGPTVVRRSHGGCELCECRRAQLCRFLLAPHDGGTWSRVHNLQAHDLIRLSMYAMRGSRVMFRVYNAP